MFIVVAIVIFGIFVSLSYTLFGSQGLTNDLKSLFEQSTEQAVYDLDSNKVNPNILEDRAYSNKNQWLDRVDTIDGKTAHVFKSDLGVVHLSGRYNLVVGNEYTFSFKAKSNKPTKLKSVYITKKNEDFLKNQEITTNWETYSFTFTANNNTTDYFPTAGPNYTFIHMYPEDLGAIEFYVSEWKLEDGNRATKYVPYIKN